MQLKESKKHNIVIHGYYGAGNFGDDIILLSIIKSLYQKFSNINVTVISRDAAPIPKGNYKFDVVSRYDLKKMISVIKNSDMFILGGGGIFHDYSGVDLSNHFNERDRGIDYYSVPLEIAYLLGKPTMAYGIGVGPLFNEETVKNLKTVLNWINVISVRDEKSREILKKIDPNCNVTTIVDPAVNLYKAQRSIKSPDDLKKVKPAVGICLRNWFFSKKEQGLFINQMAQISDYICNKYGYKVVLFPFNVSKTDKTLLNSVYENVKNKQKIRVFQQNSLQETMKLIEGMKFIIGMRLHSLVVSTSRGIPAIGISYDNKVKNYMDLVGLKEFCLPVKEIKINDLKKKVDNMVRDYIKINKELTDKMLTLKEREKENVRIAFELLNGKDAK